MAAHRITPGSIQLPFQRAAQQIEQLQLKDSQLHATILSLRDKIHNTRSEHCKDCRLYEQQIAVIRSQEKEKAEQLELTVQRLQQENSILAKERRQLYAKQQLEVQQGQQAKERQHKAGDIEILDNSKWPIVEQILDQHIQLNDIDDKAVNIQLREKRQQEILNKMKKRRKPSAKDNQTKVSIVETSSHRMTNSEFPQRQQQHFDLDPEISLQLKQLREKSAYLKQICKDYEKSLNEKNEMKERDSLRIISQLQEIQNYRKELQNMDKHYQLQCKQLQQQKENAQYELGLYIQRQETEKSTMSKRIESISAENSNLTQVLQSKHLQVFALNKNIADKDIELARVALSLDSLKRDHQHKQTQLQKLTSELSAAQSHISQLSLTIGQQKILNSALQQKTNTLLQQVDQLKHRSLALQAQSTNSKAVQAGQIDYLENIIQHNEVILNSKVQEINHLQQELAKQQNTQKRLRESLEEMFLSAQKNEMLLIQHKQKVANLESQRILVSRSLQNSQVQRVQMSSHLQRQVQQKTALSHKYLQQADKNVQLCQRINALERQLQEYRSNEMEALAAKEAKDIELQSLRQEMQQVGYFNNQMQNDILSLKRLNSSLEQQTIRRESIVKEKEEQILGFKAENQSLLAQKMSLQESNTQIILQNSRIIEQSTTEKQNLLNNIVKLQEDISTSRSLLRQRESQKEQKDLQTYSQAQRIADLQAEMLEQREEYAQLQANNAQLQIQTQSLQKSLSQSKASSIKKQDSDDAFNLKEEIRNKAYLLQDLQSQLKQTQAQHSSLLKMHDALLETERKHKENLSYLNEKIDSLNKVYQASAGQSAEELAKELSKKKQMITELLANFKYIEKALSKKQSQFDQLNEKYQKLAKTTQKRNFELENKLAAKESEASMLKREKEEESKRNAAMIKDMERLTHQLHEDIKNKERIQNEEKRQIEREMVRLTEQKKKSEQSTSREITHLKESLQVQKKKSQQSSQNTSPVKPDHSRKELQILKKEIAQKNAKIIQLQKQLSEKDSQLSTLKQTNTDNQAHIKEISDILTETEVHHDVKEHQLQKSKQLIHSLQQQIANLKAQLARSQVKYHQLQKEDTEKNLANDFMWVQLQQQKNKVKKLHNRYKESGQLKLIKQQSLEITVNSEESYFNIGSAVELHTNMESIKQEKEKQEAIELPFSIKQRPKEQQANTHQVEQQVPLTHKKSSSKNMLFQNTLSDVLSDSQQNDEINQMIKKDSDSKSHLQSSIQAFSEYSRIKSTKSELTHKQVEQHYKSKMKSTMLLAKLGKKPKKK